MITLKPNTPYAPISMGLDYDNFCAIEKDLPVTGPEQTHILITGADLAELVAFRFGEIGTVFLADRANLIGPIVIGDEPAGGGGTLPPESVEGQFRTQEVMTGFSSGWNEIGNVAFSPVEGVTDYQLKEVSMVWDDTSGSIRPTGAKYAVGIKDTQNMEVALNDFLEPTAAYPIDVPLLNPDVIFYCTIDNPLKVILISDSEPTNAANHPSMRITINFSVAPDVPTITPIREKKKQRK